MFETQAEGGDTVTSPTLPELITEGETVAEAIGDVRDALTAVIEICQEAGRPLPASLMVAGPGGPVWAETWVEVP